MTRRRHLGFPVSVLLGVITIMLGTWGWLEAKSGLGALDGVYRGIQLLALEDSGIVDPPWQIEVARYLGALAITVALLTLVFALLSQSADRLATRFFARRHHVVVGSGSRARRVAEQLAKAGERVVVVRPPEPDDSGSDSGGSDLRSIRGDPGDPKTYRWARQSRARHVLFSLGDDSENLLALEASLAEDSELIGEEGRRSHLLRHVAIDNPRLWAALHQVALTWTGSGTALQFVSIPDLVATLLTREAGSDLASGRVLICGSGPVAERTAVRAARAALVEGRRPNLRLAGPGAETLLADLSRSESWLVDGESVDLGLGMESVRPEVAFVIGFPHAETLAISSELIEADPDLKAVAEVPFAKGVEALRRSGFPVDRVRLVAAESEVIGSRVFELSPREEIARARHRHYVELEQSRGITVEENPSLVSWSQLPLKLKDSNRMFADSVGKRLEDIGGRLAPLTGPPPPPLDASVVEELASVEHDRWVTDLKSDGWTYAAGEKNPTEQTHPLLIPFSDLPDAEKAKDEDSIRRLPEVLARLGYEIRFDS